MFFQMLSLTSSSVAVKLG